MIKKSLEKTLNNSLLIISGLYNILKINNCLFDSENLNLQKKNIQYFFDKLIALVFSNEAEVVKFLHAFLESSNFK